MKRKNYSHVRMYFPRPVKMAMEKGKSRVWEKQQVREDIGVDIRGCAMRERTARGFFDCLFEQEPEGDLFFANKEELFESIEKIPEFYEEVREVKKEEAERKEEIEESKKKTAKELGERFE